MSFSFKVAPGVRVRASSRGVRASVGPRAARVHVGSGRTGVSTGFGPVGYYTSVGGGSRRRPAGSSTQRTVAAQQRQLAKAQKAEQAIELQAAIEGLLDLHRAEFPPLVAPVASTPPVEELAELQARHRKQAVSGISIFKRGLRREAKAAADRDAEAEHRGLVAAAEDERQRLQDDFDAWWRRVLQNDAVTVLELLEEAFEDNEAPAGAVGVDATDVAVVVLVPKMEVVPERVPTLTAAGNLSLKKLPKRDRVGLYNEMVAGHLLATVRETLAVAPGAEAVRVAMLRDDGPDAYGNPRLVCLIAGRWERRSLVGVQWENDASVILNDTGRDLRLVQKGQAKELQPLDLTSEPDLAALLADADFTSGRAD